MYLCCMIKIHLSRYEKEVLRLVSYGVGSCPDSYPPHIFNSAISTLNRYRLIETIYDDIGILIYAEPTIEARILLAVNPSLRNPIDFQMAIPIAVAVLSITISLIVITCM